MFGSDAFLDKSYVSNALTKSLVDRHSGWSKKIPAMADEILPRWDLVRKSVIEYSKKKDICSLLSVMDTLVIASELGCVDTATLKVTVNITSNLILCPDSDVGADRIQRFHDMLVLLISRIPEIGELESVQYSFIKSKLSLGLLDAAFQLAVSCSQPRSRLFSAILRHCSVVQEGLVSVSVLHEMESRLLAISEDDYAYILLANGESILPTVLEKLSALETVCGNGLLYSSLANLSCVVSLDVEIGDDGICPVSGVCLHLDDLTSDELDEMILYTEKLTSGNVLRPLVDAYIREHGAPTVILDAANIAHINQNYDQGAFRFDQIADIYNHYGHGTIVIHEKWMKEGKNLLLFPNGQKIKRVKKSLPKITHTPIQQNDAINMQRDPSSSEHIGDEHAPESRDTSDTSLVPVYADQKQLAEWRKRGALLEIPHGQNDDWFWMYLCLRSMQLSGRPIVVSNDLMRDHLWRMQSPKYFSKFQNCHVCQYSIKFGEDGVNQYTFFPPAKYSTTIQKNANFWHIPYQRDGSVRWLVIKT